MGDKALTEGDRVVIRGSPSPPTGENPDGLLYETTMEVQEVVMFSCHLLPLEEKNHFSQK